MYEIEKQNYSRIKIPQHKKSNNFMVFIARFRMHKHEFSYFFFIERSPLRNIFMLSLFHHSAKLAQTLKETR